MKLKELRENTSLPVKQAAKALNVFETTLYRWESGQSRVPSDAILKLAELYGVSVVDVLNAITGERKEAG